LSFSEDVKYPYFMPILEEDGDLVSGAASARPERATIYTQMLVHGLQNYVLLVEAGFLEKPGVLFGDTNPQIAIVAERFGIFSDISRQHPGERSVAHAEIRQMPKVQIHGTFSQVSERVFSEDVQRLDRALTRRLAAQRDAAAIALNS
jgi:hypothetical protein